MKKFGFGLMVVLVGAVLFISGFDSGRGEPVRGFAVYCEGNGMVLGSEVATLEGAFDLVIERAGEVECCGMDSAEYSIDVHLGADANYPVIYLRGVK